MKVSSSNVISLIESIAAGILLPMILGVTNFGYYRIYVLYSTYTTTFLSLGIIDGIVLKFGGKRYEDLNRVQFRSNTLVFLLLEFILSLIIILISYFIDSNIYSFIFLAVGINTFFFNSYVYYQFIAKTTMNFSGYSIRNSVKIILTLILILVLWILYKFHIIYDMNYKTYIISLMGIYIIMLIICIYNYKNITFGINDSLICGIKRILSYCKLGIYLTVATQISNLILIVDNQIVSMFFKASIYGKYSFSYNIINAAIMVLNAISTVLLPHLKRDTFKYMIKTYHKMISVILLIAYLALISFFPLCMIINIILPSYNGSLLYLRIFLPELGIICPITMITFNYYSVLGKSKFYFYMSTLVLFLSVIIDSVLYFMLKNPLWIAVGSLISLFVWYVLSEYFLVKWYHVKWLKNLIYSILMIGMFLLISLINNLLVGFVLYGLTYIIISLIMFKSIFRKMFLKIYSYLL